MEVAENTPTASFLTKIRKLQSAGCRLCRIAREAQGESTDGLAAETHSHINSAGCEGMATTVTASHHSIWRHLYESMHAAQKPKNKPKFVTLDKESSMSTLFCILTPGLNFRIQELKIHATICKCPSGSYATDSLLRCKLCPANTVSAANSVGLADCACAAGWTGANGECVGCEAGQYKPSSGSTLCIDCPMGKTSNASASSCLICTAGWSAASAEECVRCIAGKYKTQAGSQACTDCGAGTFLDAVNSSVNTCENCTAGTYSTDNKTHCEPCLNSDAPPASDSITDCVCNAGWSGPNSPCVGCITGKYKTQAGSEACTDCGAGTFSDAVNSSVNTCENCTAGTYSTDNKSHCEPCLNSDAPPASDSITNCVCNAGWSGPNSPCVGCLAGQYKTDAGSHACIRCAAGKFSDSVASSTQDNCVNCSAGSRSTQNRASCDLCPPGSYSMDGESQCRLCPANTNSTVGSSLSECVCVAGLSGTNQNCTACVPGKFKANAGDHACADCAAGKYSNTSAVTCALCVAGKYSTDGEPQCRLCLALTYSILVGGSLANCLCMPGWSGTEQKCTACVPGKFKANVGDHACAGCASGKYSSTAAVGCVDCDAGKYSADRQQVRVHLVSGKLKLYGRKRHNRGMLMQYWVGGSECIKSWFPCVHACR